MNPSKSLSMLAYVHYYSVREHGHGMLEQLDSSEINHGFVEATSIRTLLARLCVTGGRLSTSSRSSATTLTRTWIIDRSKLHQILARANGYNWDETDMEDSEDSEHDE